MRILVMGASGSGTTTLAVELARRQGWQHVDADDCYWLPTDPPYREKREPADRLAMILGLLGQDDVVISGSVMNWGAALEESFDLVVFLYLDTNIRVGRLHEREQAEVGFVDPAFLDWAASYDRGTQEGRNLARHIDWLGKRDCAVLKLCGNLSVETRCRNVERRLKFLKQV